MKFSGPLATLLVLGILMGTAVAGMAQAPDPLAPPADDGWVQVLDDEDDVPSRPDRTPLPSPSPVTKGRPSGGGSATPNPEPSMSPAPPVKATPWPPNPDPTPSPTSNGDPKPLPPVPVPTPSRDVQPTPSPTWTPSPSPSPRDADVDHPPVDIDPVPPVTDAVPEPQPPVAYDQIPGDWSVSGNGPPAIAPTVPKAEPSTPAEYILALLHPRQAEPFLLTLALPHYTYFQGFVYAGGGAVIAGPVRVLGGVFAGGGGRTSWLLDGAMLTTTPDYLRPPAAPVRSRFRIVQWREVQVGP